MRFSACLPVAIVLFVFLIGCSNGGANPVMPGETGLEGPGLTSGQMGTSGLDSNQQHFPLFAYRLNYDPATNSIEAVLDRELYSHINVTPWLNPPECTDCLQIFPIDSDPDAGWIELYVAVKNPFDTIGGYDARIILDAQVDGYGVVNPDGWTELFDQGGFERNPFFALSIEHPERYFAPSSQHARQFYFYYPPGGFSMDDFYVTVEISWPGNCEEPYEIVDINVENTAIPLGGNPVTVSCRVHSWFDDVESVTARIEAEGDTTPLYTLDLTHEGPGSDLWFGDISLPVGTMPPGDYKLWFETHGAYDPTISMWQVRNIEVTTDYTAWDGIANTFGGEYDDAANEVAVDDFGNVYVAGFFGGTVDFDGEDGPQAPRETHAGLDFDAYLIKYAPTGVIEWINTWGGYSSDYANGIAVDSDNGYVYVVGEFGGQVYFEDGNPDSVRLSSGGLDAYVVKYDLAGDFVDVMVLGGSGTDTGKDITLDNENNIFIGGAIEDTAWFDDVSTALTSKGGKDAFVAKLRMEVDATMYVEWAKSWGSDYNELTLGVASNSNGDVYVTGYFQDVVNFNPGMTPVVFESNGGSDVFLTKYNQGGSHRWTETWGGGDYDSGFSVAVQDDQYVYVTGYFKEDIEIGTSGLIESEGYADIFLVKWHDVAGFHSYEWLRTWGYEKWAQGVGLAVDGSDYIYMTGRYNDIVDTGPDERRVAFLRKIETADGDEDWVSDWGGPYADCWAEGASVAVDLNGYPYVAGWYLGTIDFDSGPMDEFHTSNGQMDAFVTRFDSTGPLPVQPQFHSIEPTVGYPNLIVDVVINGIVLQNVDEVWLEKVDNPSVMIYATINSTSPTEVQCSFNLLGAQTGWYNVKGFAGAQIVQPLPSAFEIQPILHADWTFMVYGKQEGVFDIINDPIGPINAMERVGSWPGIINIVVLWDSDVMGGFPYRYVIFDPLSMSLPGLDIAIISPPILDGGAVVPISGLEMGTQGQLEDFLSFTMSNFPADHYALSLKGHGGGPKLGMFKDDQITPWEIESACDNVLSDGARIDNIIFDSCIMGWFETSYMLRDVSYSTIASEMPTRLLGFDYRAMLAPMILNSGDWSYYEFGQHICESYWILPAVVPMTISAADSVLTGSLAAPALDDFALQLIDALPSHRTAIEQARIDTGDWSADGNFWDTFGCCNQEDVKDLGVFAKTVRDDTSLPSALTGAATDLVNAIEGTIFYNAATPFWGFGACPSQATGWQIWCPDDFCSQGKWSYEQLGMLDTLWDDFLYALDNPNPILDSIEPDNGDPDTTVYATLTGTELGCVTEVWLEDSSNSSIKIYGTISPLDDWMFFADFNLNGVDPGDYHVMGRAYSTDVAPLLNGFTVNTP